MYFLSRLCGFEHSGNRKYHHFRVGVVTDGYFRDYSVADMMPMLWRNVQNLELQPTFRFASGEWTRKANLFFRAVWRRV